MLISRRREGEALLVGDRIEIRIVSLRKNKVILGVIAPRDVKVSAAKLSEAEIANTWAAAQSANIGQFLPIPNGKVEQVHVLLGKQSHNLTDQTDQLTDKEERPKQHE